MAAARTPLFYDSARRILYRVDERGDCCEIVARDVDPDNAKLLTNLTNRDACQYAIEEARRRLGLLSERGPSGDWIAPGEACTAIDPEDLTGG